MKWVKDSVIVNFKMFSKFVIIIFREKYFWNVLDLSVLIETICNGKRLMPQTERNLKTIYKQVFDYHTFS